MISDVTLYREPGLRDLSAMMTRGTTKVTYSHQHTYIRVRCRHHQKQQRSSNLFSLFYSFYFHCYFHCSSASVECVVLFFYLLLAHSSAFFARSVFSFPRFVFVHYDCDDEISNAFIKTGSKWYISIYYTTIQIYSFNFNNSIVIY